MSSCWKRIVLGTKIKDCIRTQRFLTTTAADAEFNVFNTFTQNLSASRVKGNTNDGSVIASAQHTFRSFSARTQLLTSYKKLFLPPKAWRFGEDPGPCTLPRALAHPQPRLRGATSLVVSSLESESEAVGQPTLFFCNTAIQTSWSRFSPVPCRRRNLGEQP